MEQKELAQLIEKLQTDDFTETEITNEVEAVRQERYQRQQDFARAQQLIEKLQTDDFTDAEVTNEVEAVRQERYEQGLQNKF